MKLSFFGTERNTYIHIHDIRAIYAVNLARGRPGQAVGCKTAERDDATDVIFLFLMKEGAEPNSKNPKNPNKRDEVMEAYGMSYILIFAVERAMHKQIPGNI